MKVPRVTGGALADPASPGWAGVEAARVALGPVPLAAQPTAYIREGWKDREYGTTAEAQVSAATDGERLYVRIEWADDPQPNGEFQDAASAIFPVDGGGALGTLGDAGRPLDLWFWEDGRTGPVRLVARGPGVFQKDDAGGISAAGQLDGGRWSLVVSGPAAAVDAGQLGLAIWNGSNEERAGLAAVSREWLPLELD
jgi:DMSO reductase family type II enzyme heme b subunit